MEGGEQGGSERARGPRLQQRLTNEQRLQAPGDLAWRKDSVGGHRWRVPCVLCSLFFGARNAESLGCGKQVTCVAVCLGLFKFANALVNTNQRFCVILYCACRRRSVLVVCRVCVGRVATTAP